MSDDDPENLVLEHLRYIRGAVDKLDASVRDVKAELIALRKQVHTLQGDGLRRETVIADMQLDIDRIKTRLDLSDA